MIRHLAPRHLALATTVALGLSPLLLDVAAPTEAHAQSADDLAQAKKAYGEGKALFDKGKFDQAVEKFKESYRLSKNPVLLFNIALTFEKLGTNDMAIFYYKKFLSDAPEDNPQRPAAEEAIGRLGKASTDTGDKGDGATGDKGDKGDGTTADGTGDKGDGATGDKGDGTTADGTGDKGDEPTPPKKPKKPKRNTCLEDDFQHEVVDEAPPGQPLDLSAFVAEDASCEVVLYFRGHGADKFTAVTMQPRYNELVGRIPAADMSGNAVQYYIEVKDPAGATVVRVGKPTSPNVVFLDESAKPRFYADLDAGGEGKGTGEGDDGHAGDTRHDDDDNPLGKKHRDDDHEDEHAKGAGHATGGFFDVGSSKFGYAKWGATGTAAGGLALSVTFYLMASSWASSLEGEASASTSENCVGGPPCRTYDDYRKGIEATGQRYETLSAVFFGVGVVGAGVAAYYWYEELMGRKKGEHPSAALTTGLRSITASPIAGEGLLGGTAAFRF